MGTRWPRWLVLGIVLATVGYALAEDITLTTYYPSPRGVYKELRANDSIAIGAARGPWQVGPSWPFPAHRLLVAGQGISRLDPTTCPSNTQWYDENSDAFVEDGECKPTVLVSPSGQVGIGTTNPDAALDIRGHVQIRDGQQGDGKVLTSNTAGLATWADASSGGGVMQVRTGSLPQPGISINGGATQQLYSGTVVGAQNGALLVTVRLYSSRYVVDPPLSYALAVTNPAGGSALSYTFTEANSGFRDQGYSPAGCSPDYYYIMVTKEFVIQPTSAGTYTVTVSATAASQGGGCTPRTGPVTSGAGDLTLISLAPSQP